MLVSVAFLHLQTLLCSFRMQVGWLSWAGGQVGEEQCNGALHVLHASTGRCRALALLFDEWTLRQRSNENIKLCMLEYLQCCCGVNLLEFLGEHHMGLLLPKWTPGLIYLQDACPSLQSPCAVIGYSISSYSDIGACS